MTKRRSSARRSKASFQFSHWRELIGVGLLALAGVTLLSVLPTERGALTETWIALLWSGVGWGMYLIPLMLGAIGVGLILTGLGRDLEIHTGKLLALVVFYLLFLALLGLISSPEPIYSTAWGREDMGSGGYLGMLLGALLSAAVGVVGAYVVVFLMAVGCLSLLIELSPVEVVAAVTRGWRSLQDWYRVRFRLSPNSGLGGLPSDTWPGRGPEASPTSADQVEPSAAGPRPDTSGDAAPVRSRVEGETPLPPRILGTANGGQPWELPNLEDVFETGAEHEISQTEIRTRVKIIEDTLASFGVPARVIEVNQGPAVTQFGVEPGFIEQKLSSGRVKRSKVKVSKISSLSNDLALALAASPVRIEAPVPGRSIVGIEVPNMETSMVTLRSVMETEDFQRVKSSLTIALGQDVSGQPAVADLATMPHLLIAGATGSGKSVCINSIVACLLCRNTPDDLRFIMIDPKMVELSSYNGIPHLLDRVVVELERVVEVLRWTTQEMDRRYKSFSKLGARNLESYNAGAPGRGESTLPQIVVIIDELADLMMVAADEVERHVCRIAQMARATGIHLVIATQRPSVDVITGLIKANFPARVAFAVSSQVDSRVILDNVGAERLLGHGDMLFARPDSSKLARLQGCFVSDSEINRLVRYWRRFRAIDRDVPVEDITESMVQRPLLEDMVAEDQAASMSDPLLNEAIEVVRHHGRASISLLQRKLRVGYNRAARLIDILEEQEIVGSDPGGGRSREVHDDAGVELSLDTIPEE